MAPDLHAALVRHWELAQESWFPATDTSDGSVNTYPHVQGVERHTGDMLVDEGKEGALRISLTAVELYVLLAAVVFHDVGRAAGNKKGRDVPHGKLSQQLLRKNYAEWGIPSRPLAESIGRVCAFHDVAGQGRAMLRAREALEDGVIEPLGQVRESFLATLLFVADHMDGAFTRVPPEYLYSSSGIGAKGAFRRSIRGIRVDHQARMICTSLQRLAREKSRSKPGSTPAVSPEERPPLLGEVMGDPAAEGFDAEEMPVAMGKDWPKPKPDRIWRPQMLVAMVMADARENGKCLRSVRDSLATMGIPLRAWVLEVNGALFDVQGQPTIEPIFSLNYLRVLAREMWNLSARIFGSSLFSYQNLADAVQDPDLERVRRGVSRLAVLTRQERYNLCDWRRAIWAGHTQWRWNCGQNARPPHRWCRSVPLKDVMSRLETVKESVISK